jgi:hypothetical protein
MVRVKSCEDCGDWWDHPAGEGRTFAWRVDVYWIRGDEDIDSVADFGGIILKVAYTQKKGGEAIVKRMMHRDRGTTAISLLIY